MAGKMKNCSTCGKLFVSVNSSRICIDCREKEEQVEKEVVSYVRDHPKTNIRAIVEATGASEAIIRRLIREGRFYGTNTDLSYPCDHCGAPIQTGKFCDKCTKEMTKEIEAHAKAIAPTAPPKPATNNQASVNRKGYKTLQGK